MSKLTQPIKWHGGKHYLAPKLIKLMPPHTHYLEPFGGGLSVLLAKPCDGISETVNDLNGELMNFWRVLRDTPDRMLRALWCTPLSQVEFVDSMNSSANSDAVKRATAFFIRARQSRQGLQKDYCTPTRRTRRGMNENVSAWLTSIDGLLDVHERLKRVEIWNRPAIEAIEKLDNKNLLAYLDPPYVHATRSSKGEYGEFEMDFEDHAALLQCIRKMKGKCMISGYSCELYESMLKGWQRVVFDLPNNASSLASKERKQEIVWFNWD